MLQQNGFDGSVGQVMRQSPIITMLSEGLHRQHQLNGIFPLFLLAIMIWANIYMGNCFTYTILNFAFSRLLPSVQNFHMPLNDGR